MYSLQHILFSNKIEINKLFAHLIVSHITQKTMYSKRPEASINVHSVHEFLKTPLKVYVVSAVS